MVTVIIPSYNHGKYINKRIDTILSQTYKNFNILILEDASKDNSRDIIQQYVNHPKVQAVISNEINSGSVFKQWYKGIELVQSKYTWIAESDDFADKFFLEKLVQVLESDDSLGFAYCDSYIVDENENLLEVSSYTQKRNLLLGSNWKESMKYDGDDFLKNYLAYHCYVNNASAVLFKTEYLKNLTINLSDFKFAGDWAVYIDISKKSNIYYLNEQLSFYREHHLNASKSGAKDNQLLIEFYRNISSCYNFFKEKRINKNYVYKITFQLLPSLLLAKNKVEIFKIFKKINHELLYKLILNIVPATLFYVIKKINLKFK